MQTNNLDAYVSRMTGCARQCDCTTCAIVRTEARRAAIKVPRVCPVCADAACETKSKECGK